MAKIYGQDSEYIKKVKVNNLFGVFIGLSILVAFILFCILTLKYSLLPKGLMASLFFLILSVFLLKYLDQYENKHIDDYHKAGRGLEGESIICQILAQLPDHFSVFRGIKLRNNCDIDFIVIGPTGIFTIEVKSHGGVIGFDGHELTHNKTIFPEKNILRQAFSQAMDVHDYLLKTTNKDIFVTPIIVFSNPRAFVRFGLNKVKNVYVIQAKWLLDLILKKSDTNVSNLLAAENSLKNLIL